MAGWTKKVVTRLDGWLNLLTGRGSSLYDKRKAAQIQRLCFDFMTLSELYRANPWAARIVDRPADEMFRQGYQVKIKGDKETAEEVTDYLKRLCANVKLRQSVKDMRLYGGGACILGADDGFLGRRMEEPLREDRIKSVNFLTTLTPVECQAQTFYTDPFAEKFGEVELYRISPRIAVASVESMAQPLIHESRLLKFQGPVADRIQVRENYGWGDTIFERVYEAIRDHDSSNDSIPAILEDFATTVMKVEGLAEILASETGFDDFTRRLQAIEMAKSVFRGVLIDSTEEFERKTTSITGLAEAVQEMRQHLAGVADMPLTLLMGMTPSGLNANGHSDIVWWYDRVKNMQHDIVLPVLEALVRCIFLAADGPTNGTEPDDWSIAFNPLWQLDGKEEAQRRLFIAQADVAYSGAGIVSPQEIANSRFGGDEYSIETQLDQDLRDNYEEAIGRAQENSIGAQDPVEQAKAMAEAIPQTAPGKKPGAPGKPGKPSPKPK